MYAGMTMDKKIMEFISEMDNQKLEAMIIAGENPKGILQIAHGMCEHKERYIPFMEYMAEREYVCIIHDHRGHGRSIRGEQDLGYFNYNGGEYLVEDMHLVTQKIKSMYPQLPVVLFGHSMGALASRCYLKDYDDELKAAIICGCPSKRNMVHLGMILDKAMQFGKGARARSTMVDKLFLGDYEKVFKSEGENAWICSDKAVVDAYNEDPLCNFKFTLNGYEALTWLLSNAHSASGWEMQNPELAVHMIAGGDDPCIISRERFRESVNLMRKVGYKEVTSFLYDGMRHELLNEKDKAQVFRDIADYCDDAVWMNKK